MIFWMLGCGFVLVAAGFLMGYVWCDSKYVERAADESWSRHQDSLDRFASGWPLLPRCGSFGCPNPPDAGGICRTHREISDSHKRSPR